MKVRPMETPTVATTEMLKEHCLDHAMELHLRLVSVGTKEHRWANPTVTCSNLDGHLVHLTEILVRCY